MRSGTMVGVSQSDDLREFIRQMMLRFDRNVAALIRESREERRVILAVIEERGREHDQLFAEMRDLREESRAQRNALLAILDRLEHGGGPAPAT